MNNDALIAKLRHHAEHGMFVTDATAALLREAADELESQGYADLEHDHLGCPVAKTGIYSK